MWSQYNWIGCNWLQNSLMSVSEHIKRVNSEQATRCNAFLVQVQNVMLVIQQNSNQGSFLDTPTLCVNLILAAVIKPGKDKQWIYYNESGRWTFRVWPSRFDAILIAALPLQVQFSSLHITLHFQAVLFLAALEANRHPSQIVTHHKWSLFDWKHWCLQMAMVVEETIEAIASPSVFS